MFARIQSETFDATTAPAAQVDNISTTIRNFLAIVACLAAAACGGGGSGSSTSPPPPLPPPPPPVVDPGAPLSISSSNAETVLAFGAGIPEAVYGTAVFAANHLAALSNTSDNPTQVSCDSGGPSSATNLDEDGSATLTAGDTVNVFAPSGCFERLFADSVSGNFDIALTNVYTGVNGDARFDGVVSLTSGFQVDSQDTSGAPVTITIAGDINVSVALRGSFIQALSLSLDPNNELVFNVGTTRRSDSSSGWLASVFSRRTFPSTGLEENYLVRFDFSYESEGRLAAVSRVRPQPSCVAGTRRSRNPGAMSAAAPTVPAWRYSVTVRTQRFHLSVELDANGDDTFDRRRHESFG